MTASAGTETVRRELSNEACNAVSVLYDEERGLTVEIEEEATQGEACP